MGYRSPWATETLLTLFATMVFGQEKAARSSTQLGCSFPSGQKDIAVRQQCSIVVSWAESAKLCHISCLCTHLLVFHHHLLCRPGTCGFVVSQFRELIPPTAILPAKQERCFSKQISPLPLHFFEVLIMNTSYGNMAI